MSVAACFGDPPIVRDVPDETSGNVGMMTTTSEPIVDESGESDHTTSSSGSSSSSESGESGTAASAEGPETTTDDDDSSSSDADSSTGDPAEWTCSWDYYGTFDGCDCGCGIVDPDCADATVESCEYCNNEGSCNTVAACVGYIDPDNNALCVE